jgi:hypothetical protein
MTAEQEHFDELVDEYAKGAKSRQEATGKRYWVRIAWLGNKVLRRNYQVAEVLLGHTNE